MSLHQLTVEFGFIKDYPETVIDYEGDDEAGVEIIIEARFGPASGFRINNTTRSEYILIDDTKLKAIVSDGIIKDDEIHINTTRGNKSATLIRNGVSSNILNAIDMSSKWIQLQKGNNRFTSTATSGLDNVVVMVKYNTSYLGV